MIDGFTPDYASSRALFRARCAANGLNLQTFRLDHAKGPNGEELSTDVALVGDASNKGLLILSSGTHGVEGFCGAGVQGALLGKNWRPPQGVSVLLVHALNPYGFAHLRRTNEDNVDLNRNFLNFAEATPANPAYDEIHDLLVPADWDGPARAAADAALDRYAKERGARTLQAAACGGQWDHADGLFYGGAAPSWSRTTWIEVLSRYGKGRDLVVGLDFHTGLGARGACELISAARANSDEHMLSLRLFGEEVVLPGATSTAPAARGAMQESLHATLPDARTAFAVAEFGTVPFDDILRCLRSDAWLNARGGLGGPLHASIKADMRACFHGDDVWQSEILARSETLIAHTASAMAQELRD